MSHEKEQKRLNQRRIACLNKDVTHIRCDEWFGDVVTESPILFVGRPEELHGTVCRCCPSRVPLASIDLAVPLC